MVGNGNTYILGLLGDPKEKSPEGSGLESREPTWSLIFQAYHALIEDYSEPVLGISLLCLELLHPALSIEIVDSLFFDEDRHWVDLKAINVAPRVQRFSKYRC